MQQFPNWIQLIPWCLCKMFSKLCPDPKFVHAKSYILIELNWQIGYWVKVGDANGPIVSGYLFIKYLMMKFSAARCW